MSSLYSGDNTDRIAKGIAGSRYVGNDSITVYKLLFIDTYGRLNNGISKS